MVTFTGCKFPKNDLYEYENKSTAQELLKHRFLLARPSVASQLTLEQDAIGRLASDYLRHIADAVTKADSVAADSLVSDDHTLSPLVRVIVWLKQVTQKVQAATRAVHALAAAAESRAPLTEALKSAEALQTALLLEERVRASDRFYNQIKCFSDALIQYMLSIFKRNN